jgi:hypothetical protein
LTDNKVPGIYLTPSPLSIESVAETPNGEMASISVPLSPTSARRLAEALIVYAAALEARAHPTCGVAPTLKELSAGKDGLVKLQ